MQSIFFGVFVSLLLLGVQAGFKSLQKYFQFQLVEFGVVVCLGGVGAGMSMGCGAGEGV